MRVLLASAVFPPEPVVSALLTADLLEYLQGQGHDVTVICPQPSRGVAGRSGGVQKAAGRKAESLRTAAEGGSGAADPGPPSGAPRAGGDLQPAILDAQPPTSGEPGKVIRVESYRCADSRLWGRARESWDFGRQVARWLGQQPGRFDVIYTNPWPLFAPWHIARAAARQRTPVVLHVQDVYPESLVTKVPGWMYGLAARPLLALDRRIVRRCARVVVLSERIAAHYARTRHIRERVGVVRNWQDETWFAETPERALVAREYDVPADRFTFLYLGNLSALAALDSVIRAFARVARSDRQLVIVGEGSAKAACRRLAEELGLANVLFRCEPDAWKVARVQALADVFVLPTKKGGALSSTPSKCIAYMFSGKPILAAVDAESDTADDIRRADCGWICEPENEAEIARGMELGLQATAAERQARGERARQYARQQFSREVGLNNLAHIILQAACRESNAR